MPNTRTISKLIYVFALTFIFIAQAQAQTKKLKRPTSRVGISSVDTFVRESFDFYDKVYMYDGYAEAGTPLTDDDIDVLESALDDVTYLSESAPDIISDLDGVGVLKQSKATLQINRAKKALSYSIKTAKKLLSENKKGGDSDDEGNDTTEGNKDGNQSGGNQSDGNSDNEVTNPNVSDELEIYSKFDFVPGDKIIYYDDFSQDFIGDFPSKWNTNSSGEVVRLNNVEGNWFELKAGYNAFYLPILEQELPEEFTMEFDILTAGLDRKTSSTAVLNVFFEENNGFKSGTNMAQTKIPFCQYAAIGINIQNRINNVREIYSVITADIRNNVLNQPHVSIAVNKRRFRLWIDEKKYIDVPQLFPAGNLLKYVKFSANSLADGKDRIFIQNIKIAEGGLDLRRTLMNEGKVSTNGILFDSGSANIQPQSYGIIRQISQVLLQDTSMNLNIIGHTDADGADDTNMKLSKARADAVRSALISIYKISGDRLQTDGKGESQPVGDNSTSDGKAQNRRVEFVKI